MDAKQLLAAMADLFERDEGLRWTHGALARDAGNSAVDQMAPNAFSFSVNGFIERATAEGLVSAEENARAYDLFVGACWSQYHHREIVRLNDHEGRLAVIRCAREAAK